MGVPRPIHAFISALSFIGAVASCVATIKLGAYDFMYENMVDGILTDIGGGWLLNPINFAICIGVFMLPIILALTPNTPLFLVFITCLTACPSAVVVIGLVTHSLYVVLPLGAAVGSFLSLALFEYGKARGKPLKLVEDFRKDGGRRTKSE